MKRIATLFLAALGLCALPLFAEKPKVIAIEDMPATAVSPVVNLRVELDRDVLPADTRETAIVKVSLEGVRRETARRAPINLALVIDKSGSMGGDKIARAREAALEAVRRLSADDIVSLVVYDNGVRVLVPATRVGDGEALASAIVGIEASGGTNLHGGVVAGADQIRRRIEEGYTHRILLLSDGQANVGPQAPEALGSLGARLVREGISVTTIGLGLNYNEDLMTRLARRSDGNTYFVEQSRDLARIFKEELGDVLSIVARRLVIEVDFPEGVRPVRVVGRDGRVENNRAVVELNQLYGGQEKFVLVEVEVSPAAAGAKRELARATLRYEDAADARPATRTARAAAAFSKTRADVVASANHRVQADYAANRIAEAKDEAVALADAGKRFEAAERLRVVASSMDAVAKEYDNAYIGDVVASAPAAAGVIEAKGIDNATRKAIRAEAQQTYSQQRAE